MARRGRHCFLKPCTLVGRHNARIDNSFLLTCDVQLSSSRATVPHSGGGPGHYHVAAATAVRRRVRRAMAVSEDSLYCFSLYFFLSFSLAYFDLSLSKAIL